MTNEDTTNGPAKTGWDRHIKPREFFLVMGGLIVFGLLIRVSGYQFIPGKLIVLLPIAGVLLGGRMLYQNRAHPNFQNLAIATGAIALVGIVLSISLGLSIGDPIVDDSVREHCASIGMYTNELGHCVGYPPG